LRSFSSVKVSTVLIEGSDWNPKLRTEPEIMFHIFAEWFLSMPYIPVMAITPVLAARIIEAAP